MGFSRKPFSSSNFSLAYKWNEPIEIYHNTAQDGGGIYAYSSRVVFHISVDGGCTLVKIHFLQINKVRLLTTLLRIMVEVFMQYLQLLNLLNHMSTLTQTPAALPRLYGTRQLRVMVPNLPGRNHTSDCPRYPSPLIPSPTTAHKSTSPQMPQTSSGPLHQF